MPNSAHSLLETLEIESAPNPSAAVIWMHGLGADGHDFAPIVHQLDLSGCPAIRFVFPHAPSMPVSLNGGYVMPAWYDLFNQDLQKHEDAPGLRTSQNAIEQLIAKEKSRGIAADRIVLAGFSQGCAMALQTGLRHPEKLAGLLCLSGYVPLQQSVAAERHLANQHTAIFLAHGNADSVIPLQRAQQSRDLLQTLAYTVEWHEYNMQHSVCEKEISDISAWLRRVFS